jgi:hypothetical protein
MEMDLALGRVGGEVGGNLADLQHGLPPINGKFSIYYIRRIA